MKKKFGLIFSSLALVVVMIATLCACSAYNKVLKAYKNASYEETEVAAEYEKAVKDFFGEDTENLLTIHVLKKNAKEGSGFIGELEGKLGYVVIAEFKSKDEMNERMKTRVKGMTEEEKEDAKKLSDAVQNLDIVNGNCIYIIGTTTDGLSIFKSTK